MAPPLIAALDIEKLELLISAFAPLTYIDPPLAEVELVLLKLESTMAALTPSTYIAPPSFNE